MSNVKARAQKFQKVVWGYTRTHRRDFPWRRTKNPYRILVSEVMLQQTQTERVVPKYRLFLRRFPNFQSLARAKTRDVLRVWQGLGYNRRALALKRLSEIVIRDYHGKLPNDPKILVTFPGIGEATAGAISAFVFGKPVPFIETNIRRAFIHHFFRYRRKKVTDAEILTLITKTMDRKNPREWYWALMDWGATLRKLKKNPNTKSVRYRTQSKFKGSNRELRGKILALLLREKKASLHGLAGELKQPSNRVGQLTYVLTKEGFITRRGTILTLIS